MAMKSSARTRDPRFDDNSPNFRAKCRNGKEKDRENVWDLGARAGWGLDLEYERRSSEPGNPDDTIEGVLRKLDQEWDVLTGDDTSPIAIALQLLDSSSLGMSYESFLGIKARLDKTLQSVVNEHSQTFNSSIGTYNGLMHNITSSQEYIRQMKQKLVNSKQEFTAKRMDLLQLSDRSTQYLEMIQLLETIENIKNTPEKLEALLSEKRFYAAAQLFMNSMRTVNKKDMLNIAALNDMRSYLRNQELAKLHDHLFLKSSYSDNRWMSWIAGQDELPILDPSFHVSAVTSQSQPSAPIDCQKKSSSVFTGKKPLDYFLGTFVPEEKVYEDMSKNPEEDSFGYIRLLVESLHVLQKLPQAIDILSQRLPVEIHQLVDKTIAEVNSRHSLSLGETIGARGPTDRTNLDINDDSTHSEVLQDLFWTLYSKTDAVLQGERVVYDVIKAIESRLRKVSKEAIDGDILHYTFLDIWKPMQSEIRSMLRDYLADNSRGGTPAHQSSRIVKDVVSVRIKSKASAFNNEGEQVQDDTAELDRILGDAVPGLLFQKGGKIDSHLQTQIGTKGDVLKSHKTLVSPNVFNISLLLQPTVAFLERVKEIKPLATGEKSTAFTSFLDDFLVNVFLPQLEDTIVDLFNTATKGSEVFQELESWKKFGQYPIFKGMHAVQKLIRKVCQLFGSMPYADDGYSQLVIGLLIKFYQKCFDKYKDLISREIPEPLSPLSPRSPVTPKSPSSAVNNATTASKISAQWAYEQGLHDIMFAFMDRSFNEEKQQSIDLMVKEIETQVLLASEAAISPDDMCDRNILHELGMMYSSLVRLVCCIQTDYSKWFVSRINLLRMVNLASDSGQKMDAGAMEKRLTRTWTMRAENGKALKQSGRAGQKDSDVKLKMTKEVMSRFDALLATYQQLAETCLFTIRSEIRIHVLYYLSLVMGNGTLVIVQEDTGVPDPFVIELNSDLASCLDQTAITLPPRENRFVHLGIGRLIDHILMRNYGKIRQVYRPGISMLQRDARTLEQNLKGLVNLQNANLYRALEYLALLKVDPEELLRLVKEHKVEKFNCEQLKLLLSLQYSERLGKCTKRESSLLIRRQYRDQSMELEELIWRKESKEVNSSTPPPSSSTFVQ
ncbi:putative exocyst complex component sec8 [Neolecta irregularis DAH-3]|uniref:Exocyst complex component Sec8 n=1 Tax=Neolecta irregularis (strain DAH-3) TaxID=1198029 RepID=A0A1U7LR33_NEOID|nr:putative exocyst complex component sec8 [Neolecta irregularis DAH-3]|eukprot:OLL25104.1 putative exocyst complex component sec8 [Neolecta irregularis DAH-3]